MRGLSALANWSSTRPLPSRCMFSARSRAYSMPPLLGVSTSSAPNAFMVCARSIGQVLRHDQHHAVAPDRGGHGQRDAGVARGGLDQRVAGLDLAALLGALDHRQRRPVLHRAGRVVALELAQDDVAALAVLGGADALQCHQRRLADGVFDGRIVSCAVSLCHNFRLRFSHCRSGEIGRRRGLKIPRGKTRAGSIPASGTTKTAIYSRLKA